MNLGIDLGGTKIEIIALDKTGHTLHKQRTATPQNNYTETLKVITALVTQTEALLKQTGSVGICTPGAISLETGLLKNSNSVCLNGMPFKQDLEKYLQRKIKIANDANCFALSEATDGAAQGANVVFGVIIGTGTGAGIVINGEVLTGCNAIAGEWGHNPLPWALEHEQTGLKCYCGKNGCIETWLSGPGFLRNFQRQYQRQFQQYYQQQNQQPNQQQNLTTKQIVTLANQGNEYCEQALIEYEDRLARSLSHIINILDPDVIVLGGGMSNIQRLYQNVPQRWKKYVFSDSISTKLVPPKFGDSSGVRGAAWL